MSSTSTKTRLTVRDQTIFDCSVAGIGEFGGSHRIDYGTGMAVVRMLSRLKPSHDVLEQIWDNYKTAYEDLKWKPHDFTDQFFYLLAVGDTGKKIPRIGRELVDVLVARNCSNLARAVAHELKLEPWPHSLR